MKAVKRVDKCQCRAVLQELRSAFFERCLDVSSWSVLNDALGVVGVSVKDVQEVIHSGMAHADLEADRRDQKNLLARHTQISSVHSPKFNKNLNPFTLWSTFRLNVILPAIQSRFPSIGGARNLGFFGSPLQKVF